MRKRTKILISLIVLTVTVIISYVGYLNFRLNDQRSNYLIGLRSEFTEGQVQPCDLEFSRNCYYEQLFSGNIDGGKLTAGGQNLTITKTGNNLVAGDDILVINTLSKTSVSGNPETLSDDEVLAARATCVEGRLINYGFIAQLPATATDNFKKTLELRNCLQSSLEEGIVFPDNNLSDIILNGLAK